MYKPAVQCSACYSILVGEMHGMGCWVCIQIRIQKLTTFTSSKGCVCKHDFLIKYSSIFKQMCTKRLGHFTCLLYGVLQHETNACFVNKDPVTGNLRRMEDNG